MRWLCTIKQSKSNGISFHFNNKWRKILFFIALQPLGPDDHEILQFLRNYENQNEGYKVFLPAVCHSHMHAAFQRPLSRSSLRSLPFSSVNRICFGRGGGCSFEGIKCILMDNCAPLFLPPAEIVLKRKSRIVKHIYLPQTTVSTLNN